MLLQGELSLSKKAIVFISDIGGLLGQLGNREAVNYTLLWLLPALLVVFGILMALIPNTTASHAITYTNATFMRLCRHSHSGYIQIYSGSYRWMRLCRVLMNTRLHTVQDRMRCPPCEEVRSLMLCTCIRHALFYFCAQLMTRLCIQVSVFSYCNASSATEYKNSYKPISNRVIVGYQKKEWYNYYYVLVVFVGVSPILHAVYDNFVCLYVCLWPLS